MSESTVLVIAVVCAILYVVITGSIKSAKRRRRRRVAIGIPVKRFTYRSVFAGILKGTAIFAVFVGVTTLYLRTHPPFFVKWWELAFFIDLFAFAFAFLPMLPKAYRDYMDRVKEGSGKGCFADYVGAIWMSAVFISGLGLHLVTLAAASEWELMPT